ncbi:MAG: hypothetical protein JRH20_15180 [Deltaproteobacteria bacterium]|nr:hypothetical protein [Deltaproteobacteria bacterium]
MKSSRFHVSSPTFVVSLFCLALLGLPSGCSDDGPNEENCHDEAPPATAGLPATTLRVASASLEFRVDYTAGAGRNESTVVNLSLVDLSTVYTQSRFPSPCCGSMACFSLTGSPAKSCRGGQTDGFCEAVTCPDNHVCDGETGTCVPCARVPLNADKVTVSGLSSGSVDLESPAVGAFVTTSVTPPLFSTDPVQIDVIGRDEAGYFPTYSQVIEPPDALEILSPDPSAPGPAGMSDLPLKWRAGNGEWMEVTLRSSNPDITDKVVCLAVDDGCATIPIGALETMRLDMPPEDRILMTVQRVRTQIDSLSGDNGAQLKVSSRVDFALEQ